MRVIIAARLSRKQQTGQDGIGLDTQDERAREFCDREGHDVVAVTRDTISGSRAPMDRKDLGPWISDPARRMQYDAIVAYKSDRLSRGIDVDWSRIETWAADNGKRLIIVGPDGGIQYPARHDSDFWQWTAMKRQAGSELESIKERTSRAHAAIRANGGFVGRVPFGYAPEGPKYSKTLVPTPEGRALVPDVFTRVITGQSLAVIALWLQTVTGHAWWPKTVGDLVRNSVYRGVQEDAEGRPVHRCEPLVDAVTFRRAGDALASRPKRGPQNAANWPLLAEVLFCERCADKGVTSPMYRLNQSDKGGWYRCTGKGSQRKGCGAPMVRVASADAIVGILMRDDTDEITEMVLVPGSNHDSELEAIRFEIKSLAARDLPDDEYDAELARLRAERDRLAALPATADAIVERGTGETYADRWRKLSGPERGAWLRERGMRVLASKSGDRKVHIVIVNAAGRVVAEFNDKEA